MKTVFTFLFLAISAICFSQNSLKNEEVKVDDENSKVYTVNPVDVVTDSLNKYSQDINRLSAPYYTNDKEVDESNSDNKVSSKRKPEETSSKTP
jgi:hypothetical protein